MAVKNSVLKRERQSVTGRLRNRISKSKAHTAKIRLEKAIFEKNKEESYSALSLYMSELDKNVKRGIYNRNKVARLKSRATMKVKAAFDELKK